MTTTPVSPGTAENLARIAQVRHGNHHQARKTHCKHGHEFTPENTRRRSNRRWCLTCERIRHAAYSRARAARRSAA